MKARFVVLSFVALACLLVCSAPRATATIKRIKRDLVNQVPGGSETGSVTITERKFGPDKMVVRVKNLSPYTRYSVLLTHSATLGALPAHFIGEFRTNKYGNAKIRFRTEVVNAFASANQSLADANGIADIIAAGATGNGANTIPLNFVRIYRIDTGFSVFGGSEIELGGGLALNTTVALP